MSNINNVLIKALYEKYAPEKDINTQINFVNQNYDSQDKFVEDFYKKYGVELNLEKKLYINQRFGGFENLTKPTVDVKDYEIGFNEKSAEFLSVGMLSDEEYEEIDEKFKDISYFNETYLDEVEKVQSIRPTGNVGGYNVSLVDYIMGGEISDATEELVTKPVYTKDFPYRTEGDFEKELQIEMKKFIDPHNSEYNLSEGEIQEINEIKKEIYQSIPKDTLLPDNVLGQSILEEAAKRRLLDRYKSEYISLKVRDKVVNYIRNNDAYFTTRADLVKEETGVDVNQLPFSRFNVGQSLAFNVKTDFKDARLKDQSIIFKDIENFQKVSNQILDDYNKNEKLGEEILAYQEKTTQDDFEFNAEEAIKMQKNLALYKANQSALMAVIPKITLNNENLRILLESTDLLEKNYDLISKNLSRIGLGFGDIGLGALRVLSAVSNIIPFQAAWAKERGEMLDKLSLRWDNYKAGVNNFYQPDIKFSEAFKNGNFGAFVAQEISTQIPIFTTMIASGGLTGLAARGLGVTAQRTLALSEAIGAGTFIGGASGGQQYNTMTAQEMRDPFVNYSEAEKILVSAGYGAAEGVFGTAPSYLLLRNTANLLTRAGRGAAYKTSMKQYFAQNIAFPMIAEPLSEGLTTVTQNMLLDRPLMENVDHAMFSGLMFSVMMNASPAIACLNPHPRRFPGSDRRAAAPCASRLLHGRNRPNAHPRGIRDNRMSDRTLRAWRQLCEHGRDAPGHPMWTDSRRRPVRRARPTYSGRGTIPS